MRIPKLRFKEFSGEWEEKKLDEISFLIDGDRGKNYPNENDIKKIGILFLSTSNFSENNLIFNRNDKFITLEKFKQLSKGKVEKNDLIITLRGSIGNIAIFENKFYNTAFINAQMMIIRPKNINKYFLHSYFQTPKTQLILKNNSSGTAQPQLTKKDLKRFKINIPNDIQEQEKIGNFLSN
ncbi:MAG: restriction endonuclease subunit S, partial [Fusobacterium sp.]|nr:restriction endonuclease subunit S [Fusobacterium sp.]